MRPLWLGVPNPFAAQEDHLLTAVARAWPHAHVASLVERAPGDGHFRPHRTTFLLHSTRDPLHWAAGKLDTSHTDWATMSPDERISDLAWFPAMTASVETGLPDLFTEFEFGHLNASDLNATRTLGALLRSLDPRTLAPAAAEHVNATLVLLGLGNWPGLQRLVAAT